MGKGELKKGVNRVSQPSCKFEHTAKVLMRSEEKHFYTVHVISMCKQTTRKHV